MIAALVALATTAHADDKPISTKEVADKLSVFKDDFGSYYVSPKPNTMKSEADNQWVFYGDAKGMYQQVIVGSSIGSGGDYEWVIWSPRVKGLANANLTLDRKVGMSVACEWKDRHYVKKTLTELAPDATKAFLAKTPFYPRLWKRSAHFLARDDDGVYYYVDRLSDEAGGNGFKVYVGMKGQAKEMPLTNIASDSAGEIFATKGGDLKIVTAAGKDDVRDADQAKEAKAFFKKGGKKTELTVLPLMDNRYLIYRELGIYGRLGVVCDDL